MDNEIKYLFLKMTGYLAINLFLVQLRKQQRLNFRIVTFDYTEKNAT